MKNHNEKAHTKEKPESVSQNNRDNSKEGQESMVNEAAHEDIPEQPKNSSHRKDDNSNSFGGSRTPDPDEGRRSREGQTRTQDDGTASSRADSAERVGR